MAEFMLDALSCRIDRSGVRHFDPIWKSFHAMRSRVSRHAIEALLSARE